MTVYNVLRTLKWWFVDVAGCSFLEVPIFILGVISLKAESASLSLFRCWCSSWHNSLWKDVTLLYKIKCKYMNNGVVWKWHNYERLRIVVCDVYLIKQSWRTPIEAKTDSNRRRISSMQRYADNNNGWNYFGTQVRNSRRAAGLLRVPRRDLMP